MRNLCQVHNHPLSPLSATLTRNREGGPLFQPQSLATRHPRFATSGPTQQRPQPHSALCFTSQLSVYHPFPVPRPSSAFRLSTFNCRLPLPARNSQARYAIVRWHRFSRTNHTRHSARSEESLFSARGKGRHAQAPMQGAEEKWQSAPYL